VLARRTTLRARKHLGELEHWFASDDTVYPFSFLRICQALALDPGWVRAGLAHPRAAQVPGEDTALAC
jgi:hypothetical protein